MNDWENYWKDIRQTGINGQVFWDTIAERASLEDLDRFKDHLDPGLPLLDLGCGNGRQTRFLAQHFKRVIGVDVSPSAIRLAKLETAEEYNIEYKVFDAVDTKSAQALHDEFGDLNIYMRGVLHMIKTRDRAKFIDSLEILLGERGVLYQIELPSKAILYLRTLPKEVFSRIPKITRRIGFNLEEREAYYPRDKWTIIDQGQQVTINTTLANGESGSVPANYLVLKRKTPLLP
jgi:2-polyprenyl-3-methyl-5-hydroxy-6-metoxy-1,4-benzoquinol methylase